jgi:hypothetical protein
VFGEGGGTGCGRIQIAVDGRIVDPGVKIAEIPIGQYLDGGSAGRISGTARGLGIFVCANWHTFGIW